MSEEELPWWDTFRIKRLPSFRAGMEMFPFQHLCVYKSVEFPNSYGVILPTGTGKTLTSYAIFELYKTVFPNTKLIMVTTSSAVLQCEKEYEKFFVPPEGYESVAFHSKMPKFGEKTYAKSRQRAIQTFGSTPVNQGMDCMVMNYPMFRIENKMINKALINLNNNGIGTLLILDEANNFKGRTTQTHKAICKSVPLVEKAIGLTATMMEGKLEESYEIMKGMGRYISPTKAQFYDDFCIYTQLPNSYQKIVHGYKNLGEFKRRLDQFSLTLQKKDVAQYLPKINLKPIKVDQNKEQIRLIGEKMIETNLEIQAIQAQKEREKKARKEWEKAKKQAELKAKQLMETDEHPPKFPVFNFPEEKIHPVELLTEQGLVKRVLQDPRLFTYEDLEATGVKYQSPKTKELIRLLSDELVREKVVIYSPSKVYLKILEKTIKASKSISPFYKSKIGVIHGDVSIQDREAFKDEFTESDTLNIMLINDAGATALNLQAGRVIIIMGLPDTGGRLTQVVGRISRLGSKHDNLLVYFLLSENSQDEDEYIIVNQQMLLMEILDQGEAGLVDYELLKSLEPQDRLFEEFEEGDLKEEDIIELQSKNELLYSKRNRRNKFYGVK